MAMLFLSLTFLPQKAGAQDASVSFQVFYDQLSPYGTWVDDPNYGYVWIPDAGPDFQPYSTNGHWVYTEYGWTWISDYPWGWAPFHYGRWYDDPTYGSIWVPGNEWGPAWVSWRRANGYYGWAPMGPDVSINIAFSNTYVIPYNRWVFVRERNLYRNDINRYYVDRSNNVTIINNSTIINNTYIDNSRNVTYMAGPEKREVQRKIGRNITPFMLRDNNTPGQKVGKGRVDLYRPKVEPRSGDNKRSAPAQVRTFRDVKPAAERKTVTKQEINRQGVQKREAPNQKGNINQQREQTRKVQPQQNNQQKQEQIRKEQPKQNNQQRQEQLRKDQPNNNQQRQQIQQKQQPKQNNQQRQEQLRKDQPNNNQQRQQIQQKQQPQQNNQPRQQQQQIQQKQQPQQNNQPRQQQQIQQKQQPKQTPPARENQQKQQVRPSKEQKQSAPPKEQAPPPGEKDKK